MCEETAIESTCPPIIIGSYHHTCPRSPEHILHIIILMLVGLYCFKDSSPAERIAVTVDKSSRRPGILKTLALSDGQQFGLTSRRIRVIIHPLRKRREPMRCDLHIGIEQDEIFGIHLRQGPVVTLCKPVVLFEENPFHLGEIAPQQVE